MKKLITILLFLLIVPGLYSTQTTSIGIALISKYEGLRLMTYRCPAGIPTIGYGHTGNVKMGMVITKDQALAYLRYDIVKFENYTIKTIPRIMLWHEFDALIAFTFNLGYRLTGDLKSAIICSQTTIVTYKIKLYCKARVKGVLTVLKGLVRRRNDEANLYAGELAKLDFIKKLPESVKLDATKNVAGTIDIREGCNYK